DAEVEQLDRARLRIVHHVVRFEIAMHDADGVRGVHRVGNLPNDRAHLVDGQRSLSLGVFLEDLAGGPLDGEKVHAGTGFTDLDRPDDVGMLDPLAIARLAKKARDGRAILAQLFAQHFDRDGAVIRMLRAEDGRGSSLADFTLQRVTGDRLADEALTGHGANLIVAHSGSKLTAPTSLAL